MCIYFIVSAVECQMFFNVSMFFVKTGFNSTEVCLYRPLVEKHIFRNVHSTRMFTPEQQKGDGKTVPFSIN